MPLPPLKHLPDEAAYRAHYEAVYCAGPITTFDGIQVRFRKHRFDHCFFESTNRDKVKNAFSPRRAERIDWIKAALEDPSADLYAGWDAENRVHTQGRRVCLVSTNYVVIFMLTSQTTADFLTAYVADDPRTLAKIKKSPKWQPFT